MDSQNLNESQFSNSPKNLNENQKLNRNQKFERTRDFRMVEMQVMNLVNQGFSNNVMIKDIEIIGEAILDATLLFLSQLQVEDLKLQLRQRISQYVELKGYY